MVLWRKVRIDYTKKRPCHFCSNLLTKGTANVLVSDDGKEVYAGPDCTKNHAVNPEEAVPNVARSRMKASDDEADSSRSVADTFRYAGGAPPNRGDGKALLEYLLLRAEKLADFPLRLPARKREAYERYLSSGRLSRDDESYLRRAVAVVEKDYPWLSPTNLHACYGLAFWSKRLLQQEGNAPYVEMKLKKLKSRQALTPKEVEGLNKWFRNRDFPEFDPDVFSAARKERRSDAK